jgi:phosphoribosylformylglycinamidine cyclo-ligase
LHSNGFSLVRKVVFDVAHLHVADRVPELGRTVGDELLTPTRLYVQPIRRLLTTHQAAIHGLAHITGGGLPDNIRRILPPGCRVTLQRGAWTCPPVFGWLQTLGNIAETEMFRVFNLGIGFVVIAEAAAAEAIIQQLVDAGIAAWRIGEVCEGEPGVEWIG